jgi:hypothetical protein
MEPQKVYDDIGWFKVISCDCELVAQQRLRVTALHVIGNGINVNFHRYLPSCSPSYKESIAEGRKSEVE